MPVNNQSVYLGLIFVCCLISSEMAVDEELPIQTSNEESEAVFGDIKISESKLRDLAKKIDKNNDGYITREELIDWSVKSSYQDLEKRVSEDFKANDHNKDNKLTWGELLYPVFGYTDEIIEELIKSKNPADKDAVKFLKEDREKFDAVDENADGVLTKEEYMGFLNAFKHPKVLAHTTGKIMLHDKNNDSHLNREEFKRYFYVTEEPLSEFQQEDMDEIFKNYDFDKDDKLSRDELEKWYCPDLEIAANIEADHLISNSDADNDSKLTIDEIVNSKKHWKDARATNFGNHIRDEL